MNIGDDEVPAVAGDVDVGGEVVDIGAGGFHTCAILAGGALRCWGWGERGQLGNAPWANIGDDETPASVGDVDVGGPVVQVTLGYHHTCALLASGQVRCWGANLNNALLGWGQATWKPDFDGSPASNWEVDIGGPVAQLAAGYFHTCALLSTGTVRCWGWAGAGGLGYGNQDSVGDDETPATSRSLPAEVKS